MGSLVFNAKKGNMTKAHGRSFTVVSSAHSTVAEAVGKQLHLLKGAERRSEARYSSTKGLLHSDFEILRNSNPVERRGGRPPRVALKRRVFGPTNQRLYNVIYDLHFPLAPARAVDAEFRSE